MIRKLWELYWLFFKLGSITFGGGYAMLPILQRELVAKRQWTTEEELADYYAIGQCTPGIISVNTATFIGEKRCGVVGGIVATLGFVSPSLIIIALIAAFLQNFADLAVVKHAFAGVRACVCVLILIAVEKLLKKTVVDKVTLAIFIITFLLAAFTSISSVLLIVVSGLLGILVKRGRRAEK